MDDLQKLERISAYDTITWRDRDGTLLTALVEGFKTEETPKGLSPHVLVSGPYQSEWKVPLFAITKRSRIGQETVNLV